MVEVNVFGYNAEYLTNRKMMLEVKSLKGVFKALNKLSEKPVKWHQHMIFINDRPCRKMGFVKLNPGDKVSILSPVSGG